MSNRLRLTLVLMALTIVTTALTPALAGPKKRARAKTPTVTHRYVCPMHPEVQSNKPGMCPKCHMKLERRAVKVTAAKPAAKKAVAALYVCPMHPEVKSTKPSQCPKCGMALEKKAK